MPRKSRMRGSTMLTSLSKNAYIRSPRSVTFAPICMPSRSLYTAIDLVARVTSGFCPVMAVKSATAPSMAFGLATASPTPMFTTIFSSFGMRMGFSTPNRLRRLGTTDLRYRSRSLFIFSNLRLHRTVGGFAAAPAEPLARLAFDRERDLRRFVALRAHVHDLADRHRELFLQDAAFLVLRRRLRMAFHHIHAFDFDLADARLDKFDLAALAFVFAGEHDHRVTGD